MSFSGGSTCSLRSRIAFARWSHLLICYYLLTDKTLVRDLPGHIFIDLGRLLNPKSFNNLVKLAGHLGFTNSHVQNFGLHPEEATQKTLEEWEQTEGSTVDVLINILKEMKRDDCVQVLKPWDSSS